MSNVSKTIILIIGITILFTGCSRKNDEIIGQWKGALNIQGSELRLIFDIAQTDSALVTTLYSIDQTDKGITALSTEVKNKMIEIKIPSIGVVYQGKLMEKDKIAGSFTQGGATFVLDLKKMKEGEFQAKKDNGYEESNDLYTSTNVSFNNTQANVTLAGTITMPNNCKNCPAVVLVTGSGGQNRDEELMGHKPFKRIADYLSSRGIAVLRYDDRGYGESTGDFKTATTYDFLSDAIAAVDFLKTYQGIDSVNIGIAGHSEGAMIAVMAAAKRNDIAFIIPLASPMIIGKDLLLLQADRISVASGIDEATIKANRTLNSAIYAILDKEKDDKKAILDIVATVQHYAPNDELKKTNNAEMMAKTVLTPWFRTFVNLNPADYLPSVKQPALVLFGEKDLQVPAPENEAALRKKFQNKIPDNFTVQTIANVNHLFQNADKGTPAEYSNKDNAAMNDETLQTMYTWLQKNVLKTSE